MNNKVLKKIISCVLAAVMLFGISTTAFAATNSAYKNPIVVVNGIACNPLLANPNTADAEVVFPPSDTEMTIMFSEMMTIGITSISSNEYSDLLNYFVGSQVYSKLESIQLNPDGTSKSENIGPNVYTHALSYYMTDTELLNTVAGDLGILMGDRVGYGNVYVFTYDWRLDPMDNADMLDEFIQNVKKMSGKSQVSLMSEGYGSTIATTYLADNYESATADVDNFVTVNSAFEGTSLIGDLFTGRLIHSFSNNFTTTLTSAFIRYTNDVSDNPATWFSTWLVNYILNNEWETQNLMADVITMMGHVIDPLYDRYLRDLLKNFTGLWAMVPTEYYDEAMDFMFISDDSTVGDYNSDMQEKIQTFKNYQSNASTFLNKALSEGINVSVVSCWDMQLVPIGDNTASDTELFGLSAQSDGYIDTYYSSFGATTIPLNDVGAAIQNKTPANTEGECIGHSHLSSDYDSLDPTHSLGGIAHYIDASTCALPENTWFIKNMKYGSFDTTSNAADFLAWLATTDKSISIRSNVLYNQFMHYNRYVKPGYLQIPDFGNLKGDYLLGDVNLDGKVTPADARLALRISARLDAYPDVKSTQFKNADVNGDGVITPADARIILRVASGLSNFSDFQNTTDIDK